MIYRVKFDEKAEEIWELIGKAKGYAYNQMGTFRATVGKDREGGVGAAEFAQTETGAIVAGM